ncbi:MAG: peptidoglycan-binding protein [Clostridiales bacterium]|nr:peptidoglycan-binding protein [Clostridiales bacterium]
MAIYIGSARHDENGAYSGGAAGDQLQTSSTNDKAGEVSMQAMYTHSKGWYILRPVSADNADDLAYLMKQACNNACIGYDQGNRLAIISAGISTTSKTECDCSSLVRACIIKATGTDPGNFTTANEVTKLAATGLFEEKVAYVSQAKTPVYNGDILVTKTKGHTVIVVSGNPRTTASTTTTEGGFDVSTLSTIKKGSTGAQVKSLQSLLNGKAGASLDVDGSCGSKTVAAIKSYQSAQGLTVDGIAGVNTWTSLLTK